MMILHNTRFLASAAIATLAIGSTPLLAQVAPAPVTVEPAPVLVFPETIAPAPAAQPAIVLPDLEAAPPPAIVTAPEPATTRTARAASPAAAAEPRVRAAAPVADDPVVAADQPSGIIAPLAAAEPVTPIAAAEPQPAAEPVAAADNTIFWVAALAGLAAIVLAIWGFIAIGRRRPVHRKAAAIVERPVMMPRVPEPEAVAPAAAVTPLATARRAEPSLSHTGASVPLPSKAPETFAERDALIRRMIAARPDRANPFTSPIQRRKRAKLILQSLGRDFSDRAPWIDLSQYPQNWPELARRKQAAA